MRIADFGLRAIGCVASTALVALVSCSETRRSNTAVHRPVRASREGVFRTHFKAAVLYPARDILLGEPLWRALCSDEGEDSRAENPAVESFWTRRQPHELTPEALAQGPGAELFPQPPFRIDRIKNHLGTFGFFGTDAEGREYIVKRDDPAFPELGSSVAVIATRIYHALGYHVPPVFPITIEGTGDARFDGHRATASPLIADVLGHFQFDWFRDRREMRGIRMVAAWLNDTDRGPNNNLVTVQDGSPRYYLIDFNSALGAWQGRPKEPWRGWRYGAGSGDALVRVLTLGLVRPGYNPRQPVVTPAVGRFDADYDPRTWAPQVANTAFDRLTVADRDWIVRLIAHLDRPRLEAIVSTSGLSRPEDREYIVETLLARQAKMLGEPRGLPPRSFTTAKRCGADEAGRTPHASGGL